MARKGLVERWKRPKRYKVREYTRCSICGRTHSVYQEFGICRVCFRKLANEGKLPGVRKASW
ncbi:MAG TPA: type Z 30S ribosomal protein S14 [Fervidobacterium sp.]|nr:type Z 30S ribosomal protein S14 [Thermotogaceae bacterium]HOA16800.1 type Z 30S ribosomal protein S14 [Fervidobacterium sp.]HOH52808.1 type Z 30S ribosomal protein S14 [Fervidobacterium sp.]HOK33922.1 type Z 30S ribosomal protein S14 [Fervidobacterium sp.]HOL04130.1 type Z 30S ribosomal protein S14 [Fervidobacterium sp.]